MIARALEWIAKALLVLASLLAFVLCFVVVTDVAGRALFNTPLRGTPELVSSSIVIICFLQATYAVLSGGMMRVEALTANLPWRLRAGVEVLSCLLGFALFAIICSGSVDGLIHAWTSGEYEGEGALRVPVWPVRLAVLAGSGLCAAAYLLLAWRQLLAARHGTVLATGASH